MNPLVKHVLILIAVILQVGTVDATKYRNFTNQDGKTIVAKVVDYDSDSGKVQLELKNRKKAWLELSILSSTDQAYVINWYQEVSIQTASKKGNSRKPLSEEQMEEIANTYIAAIQNRDYAAFSNLMASTAEVSKECFMSYFGNRIPSKSSMRFRYTPSPERIKSTSILTIDKFCVVIEMQMESGSVKGVLVFLPDGKIKYDAIYHQHPVSLAQRDMIIFVIKKPFPEGINHDWYSRALIDTGIPLYGFDPESSKNDQLKSLGKIWDWLNRKRNKWDASDPKVFLPRKVTDLLGWDYNFSLSEIVD